MNCHVAVKGKLEAINGIKCRLDQATYYTHNFRPQHLKGAFDDFFRWEPIKMGDPSTLGSNTAAEPVNSTNQLTFTNSTAAKRQEYCPDKRCRHHHRDVVNVGKNPISESPQNPASICITEFRGGTHIGLTR